MSDDIFDLDDSAIADSSVPPKKTERVLSFLKELNDQQREAVEKTEGPLLVLSGAGTGKTRVLTTRIAYIIACGLAAPWQILAVTFTNKAAKEMKERLFQMLGPSAQQVFLGTFHQLGLKIISKHPEDVGLKSGFIILDTDDQERLLKKIMLDLGIDIKKHKPSVVLDIISRWKDKALPPSAIKESVIPSYCMGKCGNLYTLYQHRLRELNAVDFGDLLLLPIELFKLRLDVLLTYQKQFQYVLVDEYQDTNVAQYLLLGLLSKGANNLCCVGDDDQSIYSWRGAEVGNILNFKKNYPDATVIRLEQNYRSTPQILGAASALIENNADRLGKSLYVADGREVQGSPVKVLDFYNGKDEAMEIVSLIQQERDSGIHLNQIAILVRAAFQTRLFEDILIKQGIPYKIIGGFKFYEREEIRDAIAYLRLLLNKTDDLAFLRIVNKPKRGIGPAVLDSLMQTAKENDCSLFQAIQLTTLKPAVQKTLSNFTEIIQEYTALLETTAVADITKNLLTDMGYIQMWQQDKSPEAEGRLENINELLNGLAEFESLQQFIEYTALLTDADEKTVTDNLVLMTLHASKGLEFDVVFLPGWEEGLFPHQKALDEQGDGGLEEERRLAYVGLTRAKKKACISYAANRQIYGRWQNSISSRFVEELPDKYIERARKRTKKPAYSFSAYEEDYAPCYSSPSTSKRIGKRVRHDVFGTGTVLKDNCGRLEIHFDDHGIKNILARFVELAE